MAGLGVRLYTDEMISPRLAEVLRQHGYDAESCQEAQRATDRGHPAPIGAVRGPHRPEASGLEAF